MLSVLLIACKGTAPVPRPDVVDPYDTGLETDADTDADTDTDTDTDADTDADPLLVCEDCHQDAAGVPLEAAHPQGGAATQGMTCTSCHGGVSPAIDAERAHVPRPPQIGDDDALLTDPGAWYRYRTLRGLQDIPTYIVGTSTWSGLDYLQFRNPGDLYVVASQRSCGTSGCHFVQAGAVFRSVHATEPERYAIDARVGAAGLNEDLFAGTAPDLSHWDFDITMAPPGALAQLDAWQTQAAFGGTPLAMNATSGSFGNDIVPGSNRVASNSVLHQLLREAEIGARASRSVATAGENLVAGGFRSGGCSACHVRYANDGRSQTGDLAIPSGEPMDPDALVAPERPHPARHRLLGRQRQLPTGGVLEPIPDATCAACHAEPTAPIALSYAGIRLDPAADVTNGHQYPAMPTQFSVVDPGDARFFGANGTWQGYTPDQLVQTEVYGFSGVDASPADVHAEAGMLCIDCHGAPLHGNATLQPSSAHASTIRCISCHGTLDDLPEEVSCGTISTDACATDAAGRPLDHVRWANQSLSLFRKADGVELSVPLVKHIVDQSHSTYSQRASYAMGRDDGVISTGSGPVQGTDPDPENDFSHTGVVSCIGCHASWQPTFAARQVELTVDDAPSSHHFESVNGTRTVLHRSETLIYGSPLPFRLRVGQSGRIEPGFDGPATFFRFVDSGGEPSDVFAFSDRNGWGNDPQIPYPALDHASHNAHTIRGARTPSSEGVRACAACHLLGDTDPSPFDVTLFDAGIYDDLTPLADLQLLPQNAASDGLYPQMALGLGTGLYVFDVLGCPVNPTDNTLRGWCAPDPDGTAYYDLDRLVTLDGQARVGLPDAFLAGASDLRGGPLAGPLDSERIQRMRNLVLDSWLNPDGSAAGTADPGVPPN